MKSKESIDAQSVHDVMITEKKHMTEQSLLHREEFASGSGIGVHQAKDYINEPG